MKVHHVAITVDNLLLSSSFYQKMFGFKLVKEFEKPEIKAKGQFLKLGDFHIELWQFANAVKNKEDHSDLKIRGIKHLSFQVEDIHQEIQQFKEKGLFFDLPKKGVTCRWYSFAKDPNGICLELYQP